MKIFKKILLSATVLGAMASGTAMAADKIVLDGSTTVGPIAKAFAEHFTKTTGVKRSQPPIQKSTYNTGYTVNNSLSSKFF